MTNISDAYESAYTIMLNLNRSWIQKQGDFFVESPIILLAAIIWFLKIYEDGKYCTFPHAIEFLNHPYAQIFLQQRQSMTINRNDKSTSISTQLDSLIPASKISNLTQGMFVGAVSDNFDERIEQKIFHAEILWWIPPKFPPR